MFGPDSAKDGWQGQNFVYEKTRVNKIVFDGAAEHTTIDADGNDIDDEATVEGMDRIERFLR
jgi:hypothetical protein